MLSLLCSRGSHSSLSLGNTASPGTWVASRRFQSWNRNGIMGRAGRGPWVPGALWETTCIPHCLVQFLCDVKAGVCFLPSLFGVLCEETGCGGRDRVPRSRINGVAVTLMFQVFFPSELSLRMPGVNSEDYVFDSVAG